MTTVRLTKEIDLKLEKLIELEKTSKSEVIKKAISEYYDSHYLKRPPFEVGEHLFGKYGSGENLSTEYKNKLKDKLNAKHAH